MRKPFVALIFVAALGGCQTAGGGAGGSAAGNPNLVPPAPGYRETIAQQLRQQLRDPYTVRDVGISAPAPGFVGLLNGGEAMVVCVRMNGKNAFGAYTGLQAVAVVFRNGLPAGFIPAPIACEGRVYEPFPEFGPPN